MKSKQSTLFVALSVAFVDFFGMGLVYPLFSSMLFGGDGPTFLLADSSTLVRGIWLGCLLCCMPLMQFFFAPLWGAVSDNSGRKKPLQLSLLFIVVSYAIALAGVGMGNIFWLLLSRLLVGMASGNTTIVQAAIADLSESETKARNFGLYTLALGLGFALGPFLGGLLSNYGYSLPFVVAAIISILNLLLAGVWFAETLPTKSRGKKLHLSLALIHLKEAFQAKFLRNILITSFLYTFGWSYFFEFAPVYLIERLHFSSVQLGFFYGVAATFYALSTAFLIGPFVKRFKAKWLCLISIASAAFLLFVLALTSTLMWLLPLIFFLTFFISFVSPATITLVSESVGPEEQGKALGNLNAVNSAAYMFSPLLSGYFVGINPTFPMWIGGAILLISALWAIKMVREPDLQSEQL